MAALHHVVDGMSLHFGSSAVRRRAIAPQDNARVNRADGKCKLVKIESDTMGGHDHPTTGQTQRLRTLRFNALLSRLRDESLSTSYRNDLVKSSMNVASVGYLPNALHAKESTRNVSPAITKT